VRLLGLGRAGHSVRAEKCAVVGVRGFEPRVSASQAQRVTGLRYTPTEGPTRICETPIPHKTARGIEPCSPNGIRPDSSIPAYFRTSTARTGEANDTVQFQA
jgi:hypothetical protein